MRSSALPSSIETRRGAIGADKAQARRHLYNISRRDTIAAIHFNRGKVYARHILTHEQYSRGGWKR